MADGGIAAVPRPRISGPPGDIENAFKTALAKGDVGIVERKKMPTFQEFSKPFMDAIRVRSADKPATVGFYADRTVRLLKYRPLREARLDAIDEALIERYVTAAVPSLALRRAIGNSQRSDAP